jgi:hypothetical protein
MKCEWVRQNVILYLYEELADDGRYEFEQHVARCTGCAAEVESGREFQQALAAAPVAQPTPNLLTAARMRLQEALETAEQGGFWQRFVFDPGAWLRQIRFSPALAMVLVMVGFGGGVGAMYFMHGQGGPTLGPLGGPPPDQASISGIRSVTKDPSSDRVSIQYDTVTSHHEEGAVSDQRIQQLLLFAARNNYNSGVRVDSIDLLTQQPNDLRVREALVYALRYDNNPGVRLKALEGLGSYVKGDVRVRNAVLDALLNDGNPGVRVQALHLLEPVKADGSVRVVLQRLAESDQSQFIRTQARNALAQLPEID